MSNFKYYASERSPSLRSALRNSYQYFRANTDKRKTLDELYRIWLLERYKITYVNNSASYTLTSYIECNSKYLMLFLLRWS